jgi:hypothetical protein
MPESNVAEFDPGKPFSLPINTSPFDQDWMHLPLPSGAQLQELARQRTEENEAYARVMRQKGRGETAVILLPVTAEPDISGAAEDAVIDARDGAGDGN